MLGSNRNPLPFQIFKHIYNYFTCINIETKANDRLVVICAFSFVMMIFFLVTQFNKAGYTATLFACRWVGAIYEVTRPIGQEQRGQKVKILKKQNLTDGRTDRWTDQVGCSRVHATKKECNKNYSVCFLTILYLTIRTRFSTLFLYRVYLA